jgi:hypothetical protein
MPMVCSLNGIREQLGDGNPHHTPRREPECDREKGGERFYKQVRRHGDKCLDKHMEYAQRHEFHFSTCAPNDIHFTAHAKQGIFTRTIWIFTNHI